MLIMNVNHSPAQQPAAQVGEEEFLTVNMVMPAAEDNAEGAVGFGRLLFGLMALALERFGATQWNHAPDASHIPEASRSTELPVDPFDGQLLRFREADGGYQLHRIVPDLTEAPGGKGDHMNTLRILAIVMTKLLSLSTFFIGLGFNTSFGQTMMNGVVTHWGGPGHILSIEVPPGQATLQIKGWDVFDGPCIDGAPGVRDIDTVGHLYYQIGSPPCFDYGDAGELEICSPTTHNIDTFGVPYFGTLNNPPAGTYYFEAAGIWDNWCVWSYAVQATYASPANPPIFDAHLVNGDGLAQTVFNTGSQVIGITYTIAPESAWLEQDFSLIRPDGSGLPYGYSYSGPTTNKPSSTYTWLWLWNGTDSIDVGGQWNMQMYAGGQLVATLPFLVVQPPEITAAPSDVFATIGSNATFTVSAPGGEPPSYQWLFNGTNLIDSIQIIGSQSNILTVLGVQTNNTGSYQVIINNSFGSTTSAVATLMVTCPAITLIPATPTLPGAGVGVTYSQNLTATGGVEPYTFAITVGSLPAELILSASGSLSGTPSTIGTNNFTVTATDTNGCPGSQSFALVVSGPATNWTWNGSVSSDWFNPTNWTPVGIPGLNDAVNFTTGTDTIYLSAPVTNGGQFNWSGRRVIGSLTIASNGVLNISGGVTLLGALFNAGTVNWLNGPVQVQNQTPFPESYFFVNLAGGVWNIQCDQVLSGLYPYTNNTYFQNAGTVQKSAGPGTTSISIPFYNTGTVSALQGTLNFTDGLPLTNGTLNFGLSAPSSFGTISVSGTANLGGGVSAVLQGGYVPAIGAKFDVMTFGSTNGTFTDYSGLYLGSGRVMVPLLSSAKLTLQAQATVCPTITVSPVSISSGTAGVAYTQSLTATGGAAPYTFAVPVGGLPTGLSMSNGVISGVPTTPGPNTFTVTATDTNGCPGRQSYTLTVLGMPPSLTVQPQSITNAAGTTATFTVGVSGTSPFSYQWQFNGTKVAAYPPVYSDDFESYTPGSNLIGQGGWMPTISGSVLVVTNGQFLPTQVIDGRAAAGLGQQNAAQHAVTLDPSRVNTLQFAAYATSEAPTTHSVDVGLLEAGVSDVFWGAVSFTNGLTPALGWEFAVSTNQVLFVPGGFDRAVRMEIVVDGVADEIFGTYDFGSGPVETSHFTVAHAYIAGLNGLAVLEDHRQPALYSGMEIDNINLSVSDYSNSRITSSQGTNLTIVNVQLSDAGGYQLIVTNAYGSVTSSVATLTETPVSANLLIYDARLGTLPPDQGFVLVDNGIAPGATVSGGLLNQNTSGDNAARQWWYAISSNALDFATGFTLEANLKVISSSYNPDAGGGKPRAGYGFDVVDDMGRSLSIAISSGGLWLDVSADSEPWGITTFTPFDATSGFNNYRLVAQGGTATLYINGSAFLSTPLGPVVDPVDANGVSFGENTAFAGSQTELVWFRALPGAAPAISVQPQSQNVIAGTNVSFGVVATGTEPLSYQWQFNGTNLMDNVRITGSLSSSLTISNVLMSDAGGYRVMVTNAYGSTTSAVATLIVTCPVITLAPGSPTFPSGTLGVMYNQTLSASGGAGSYSFTNTAGSLPSGLSLGSAGSLSGTPSAIGTNTFTVTATDTNGCAGSQTYSLQVLGIPPSISAEPQNITNSVGTMATFTVTATGTDPLSYQWQFNGVNTADNARISGSSSRSLTISNVGLADAGTYGVVVTNLYGAVTSTVASLAFWPCDMVPAGLVNWWRCEGNALDSVGTNDGISVGGVTGVPGMVGGALQFDGSSAEVAVSNAPNLQTFSVETWVRFDSLDSTSTSWPGQQYLVFRQNSREYNFEAFALAKERDSGGDRLRFIMTSVYPSVINDNIGSTNYVTAGLFYHVVGTFDATNMHLYVNGVLHAAANHPYPVDYGQEPMFFGNSGTNVWYGYLAGTLDEVSLYNRPLSPSEVATLYAAGSAGKCPVSPPPLLRATGQTNGTVVLNWTAVVGRSYQVQSATNLHPANWSDMGGIISTTNRTVRVSTAIGQEPRRFYRVLLLP